MLYRGSAKVCGVVCVKKIQLRMVLCIPCLLCETISHPAWQYVLMFFCQKNIFTQNTRNTQNFASHGLQSVRYIKLFYIQQKHHPAVISYFCLPLGNGNCPVNTSNSMNIKMFEWYKPHSLHDSPEPTVADRRVKQRG